MSVERMEGWQRRRGFSAGGAARSHLLTSLYKPTRKGSSVWDWDKVMFKLGPWFLLKVFESRLEKAKVGSGDAGGAHTFVHRTTDQWVPSSLNGC